MAEHQAIGSVWRHKKTGGLYTIMGTCRLEATNAPAFLYRSWYDGTTWARDMGEFLDGRFEQVALIEDRVSHARS